VLTNPATLLAGAGKLLIELVEYMSALASMQHFVTLQVNGEK